MNPTGLSTRQARWYSYLAFWIIPISGACTDIYVPSLPHIMTALNCSETAVKMTVAVYTLGLSFGQLIAGPISDCYGRKITMIIGTLLQALFISIILLVQQIHVFLYCRFFQGLAVALLVVSARAVLSDLFTGNDFKKKVNLSTLFWAIGPIIAPAIGGYLQYYINWRASFYAMLTYILITLCFLLLISETHPHRQPLKTKKILQNYTSLIKNRSFMLSMLLSGMLGAFANIFNILAPFLVQVQLQYNAIDYGRIALSMGLAWFFGNLINQLFHRYTFKVKAQVCISLLIAGSASMVLIAHTLPLSIKALVLPSFCLILLAAVLFPNPLSSALAPFRHIAGSANAFLFSGVWFCGYALTNLGALFHTQSLLPLASINSGLALACLIVFLLMKQNRQPQAGTVN